jgi:hypothetical protein
LMAACGLIYPLFAAHCPCERSKPRIHQPGRNRLPPSTVVLEVDIWHTIRGCWSWNVVPSTWPNIRTRPKSRPISSAVLLLWSGTLFGNPRHISTPLTPDKTLKWHLNRKP